MPDLPLWAELTLAAAAVITAARVIWGKLLKPAARLISNTEEMLPLIRSLTVTFRDVPHAFDVLDEIVAQFRTNSGSSLRDAIDRLETAAQVNSSASEVLKVQVEVVKELASQDRRQLERLITLLNYLDAKVTIGTETVKRMEESTAGEGQRWDLDAAHQHVEAIESAVDRSLERRHKDVPVEHDRRKRE